MSRIEKITQALRIGAEMNNLRSTVQQLQEENQNLVDLLEEAYGYTTAANSLLPEKIRAAIAKNRTMTSSIIGATQVMGQDYAESLNLEVDDGFGWRAATKEEKEDICLAFLSESNPYSDPESAIVQGFLMREEALFERLEPLTIAELKVGKPKLRATFKVRLK